MIGDKIKRKIAELNIYEKSLSNILNNILENFRNTKNGLIPILKRMTRE